MSRYLERLPWLTAFGWMTILTSFSVGLLLGMVGGMYALISLASQVRAS